MTPQFCKGEVGCHSVVLAKGLCSRHYYARRRKRLGMKPRGEPVEEEIRFKVSTADLARLQRLVPEGERAAWFRSRLRKALSAIERRATSQPRA